MRRLDQPRHRHSSGPLEGRRLTCGIPVLLGVVMCFLSWDGRLVSSFHLDLAPIKKCCHAATENAKRITDIKRGYKFRADPLFGTDNDDGSSEFNLNSELISESSSKMMGQQLEIDENVEEDLPMFSFDFNGDNVDRTAIPIPMFTASVIFLYSMAVTYYLYDVGINGFPDV